MVSPYPIAAVLGSLLHLMRHQPNAGEDGAALVTALKHAQEGERIVVHAEPELLSINGHPAPLDAPGATLLYDQLLVHGLGGIEIPPDTSRDDILRLAAVVGSFAGSFGGFDSMVSALRPGTPIRLLPGEEGAELVRDLDWQGRGAAGPDLKGEAEEDPSGIQIDDSSRLAFEGEEAGVTPEPLSSRFEVSTRSGTPSLDVLVRRGRTAIEAEDWVGLLDAALSLAEAEAEAPSDLAGSSYRMELKRLMSRKHVAMIARLTTGDRKQEAVTLLRRFAAEATEALMELLVEGLTMGERRAYYTALTQMTLGTEAIVQRLGHRQWYVVRNAADLCGELALSDAVPELAQHAHHADERVRKSVAAALSKIGAPAATESLSRLLHDPSHTVRLQSVAHLEGRRGRGLVGPIAELLRKETHPDVQREALHALGRIGTPDAIRELREAASPGPRLVGRKPLAFRLAAVRGLGLAGPVASDALAALQRDDAPEVRDAVSAALTGFRPAGA